MGIEDIPLRVHDAREFGREAETLDPRTPEHRAAEIRRRISARQWRRLPLAAAADVALAAAILTGLAGAGHGREWAVVALAAAAVLALIPLAGLSPGPALRRAVAAGEAVAAALGVAALIPLGEGALALACCAALAGITVRAGTAAWVHLALIAAATPLFAAGAGFGALAGVAPWLLIVAAGIREQALRAHRELEQGLELEELRALCISLAGNAADQPEDDSDP